jgi:anti-sigma regulatory factor (Ser/Thr protein kinase)
MDTPDIPAAVLVEQSHLRLPSRPDWIEAIVEYVKTKALLAGVCQETRASKLMVALHEALSNAMIHGNLELASDLKERGDSSFAEALAARMADAALSSRHVDLVVDYDGERCRWIITDQGQGFDVDRALARASTDDPEVLLASGRGIIIMRSFLDDVRYELGGRRIILTLLRASGAEKRQHNRVPFQQPLQVVPVREDGSVDWDAAYEAVSRNICQEGLNLLQDHLSATSRVIIGLPAGGQVIYIPAEIRHCRTITGDVVELGCRFQATPAAAGEPGTAGMEAVHQAVDALLEQARLSALAQDERRTHSRFAYLEKVEVRGEGQPTVTGFARNLSKGGISFLATSPLPYEERVFCLPNAGGHALGLRARIVRCVRIKEGLYDIGASFIGLAPTGGAT